MVFKIVRTDTVDPCKIQLPVGTHKFGRGIFLDCEDKRVSRNHGQLEVSADSVILKALHRNPCFFVRKGTQETEILRSESSTNLNNGDKFGLLPDSYWYELLHCTALSDINTTTKDVFSEKSNEEGYNGTNLNETNAVDESALIDFQLNETIDNEERPQSPSIIVSNNQSEEQVTNSANQNDQIDTTQANTPPKRLHVPDVSSSEDEAKKIKTEPSDASCSTSDGISTGVSSSADQKVKDAPSNNSLPLRERCMYGAQCYRKNPQHKEEFSHPSDRDWGAGERGVCPRGAACVKRDPRHWRDHDHPPGTTPPSQQPGNAKKPRQKRRSSSSEDEDVSPMPDLNLSSKRVRKTLQRQNWSDSESGNEDPFGTDGSEDEWAPTSKGKASQETPSP